MRISDWSSDVCSSDLSLISRHGTARITRFDLVCGAISVMALIVWLGLGRASLAVMFAVVADAAGAVPTLRKAWHDPASESALFFVLVDRKSVVSGKGVSVRVDLGGRRIIKKKT